MLTTEPLNWMGEHEYDSIRQMPGSKSRNSAANRRLRAPQLHEGAEFPRHAVAPLGTNVGQPILAAAGFQPAPWSSYIWQRFAAIVGQALSPANRRLSRRPRVSAFFKPVRPTGSAGGLAAGMGQSVQPGADPKTGCRRAHQSTEVGSIKPKSKSASARGSAWVPGESPASRRCAGKLGHGIAT